MKISGFQGFHLRFGIFVPSIPVWCLPELLWKKLGRARRFLAGGKKKLVGLLRLISNLAHQFFSLVLQIKCLSEYLYLIYIYYKYTFSRLFWTKYICFRQYIKTYLLQPLLFKRRVDWIFTLMLVAIVNMSNAIEKWFINNVSCISIDNKHHIPLITNVMLHVRKEDIPDNCD